MSENFSECNNGLSAGQGLTESEKGWLAGIWDGEGTITLAYASKCVLKPVVKPHISVSNTNVHIIDHAIFLLDKAGIKLYISTHKGRNRNQQDYYSAAITNIDGCEKLCKLLKDYLVGKLPQCNIMLRFLENRKKNKYQNIEDVECLIDVQKENRPWKYTPKSSETKRQIFLKGRNKDIVQEAGKPVSV